MVEDGTKGKPYTRGGPWGQAYKWCKCSQCGVVRRCTPSSDFYVRGKKTVHDDEPLFCLACVNPSGEAVVVVPHPN